MSSPTIAIGQPKISNATKETVANKTGEVIEYTPFEKRVAVFLTVYLLAMLFIGIWVILDVWTKRFLILNAAGFALPAGEEAPGLLQVIVYGIAGGFLGGVISSVVSLQEHYAAVIENVGDLKSQDKDRFHTEWSARWFWGPWQGMVLALAVIALLRSGLLVFAGSGLTTAADSTSSLPGTMTESFTSFGLGVLVGISAKEVFAKLNQIIKARLRVEEPEAPKLDIIAPVKSMKYGDPPTEFTVKPAIAVTWDIAPNGEDVGTLRNGFFTPARTCKDEVQHVNVLVTATSRADKDRSASVNVLLEK